MPVALYKRKLNKTIFSGNIKSKYIPHIRMDILSKHQIWEAFCKSHQCLKWNLIMQRMTLWYLPGSFSRPSRLGRLLFKNILQNLKFKISFYALFVIKIQKLSVAKKRNSMFGLNKCANSGKIAFSCLFLLVSYICAFVK